jgi:nitrite reductase (NADH) small subunit
MTTDTLNWTAVCAADAILPNTGVCALVEDRHVAVFRVGRHRFYAIDNIDPKSGASILARGLVGNLGERIVVASPIYKNHFRPGHRRMPGGTGTVGAGLAGALRG